MVFTQVNSVPLCATLSIFFVDPGEHAMVLGGTEWEDGMRTARKKKRVGRPRSPERRPVLAARVPEQFHAQILASAAISGRNASEELMARAQQSYEWEAARGTVNAMLAEAKRITARAQKVALEQTLQERGYTKVQGIEGAAWLEPGVSASRWIFANIDPIVLQKMLDRAAMRALELAGVKS
jgi:hypothetical protein